MSDEYRDVVELAANNDIEGLIRILENNSDSMLCLEAAMALAQLGDKRGLKYLQDAVKAPDAKVNSQARKILAELNLSEEDLALPQKQDEVEQELGGESGNPEGRLAVQAPQADKDQHQSSVEGKGWNAKYPYLTGYVGFIALYALASLVIGFLPFRGLLSLALLIVVGFYVFRFIVKNNILPYV